MKSKKFIWLALTSVFVLNMLAVAPASAAEPEFGRCKKEAGSFKDPKCDEGGGTEFNWVPLKAGEEVKFESTSGVGVLETASLERIHCQTDKDAGETKGPKEDLVVVRFFECESSGFKCMSKGAAAGEIVTNELESELGYINAAKHEVGLDLKPSGELFVEFECVGGIVKVKTRGSVIGRITPVLEMSNEFTLAFKKVSNPCTQEIERFEGELKDTLETSKNGGAFEGACEETTDTIKFSPAGEKLEIKG